MSQWVLPTIAVYQKNLTTNINIKPLASANLANNQIGESWWETPKDWTSVDILSNLIRVAIEI